MWSLESIRRSKLVSLSHYMVLSYTVFLLGFFFIPNAVTQYKIFIGTVFLPGLFAVIGVFKVLKRHALWNLILLYLSYMLITSFWSIEFSLGELWYSLRLAAYIVMFIAVTVFIYDYNEKVFDRIIKLVSLCASIAATVSIVIWYSDHPFPAARLVGIGTIENPNPSAFIYGFFAVLSCYYTLGAPTAAARLGFASVCTTLLVFVALTQSNTGILATILSLTFLLILSTHNKLIVWAAGIAGVGLAALYLLSSVGMISAPTDIGLLERFPIWRTVLEQISDAPLFGNGLQKELLITPTGESAPANYAHNTFLATARDGGLVGVALHLMMLLTAVVAAYRIARADNDPIYISLLAFGFVCMSADTDQLITRPRELWVIYWLPLAMILAKTRRTTEGTTREE